MPFGRIDMKRRILYVFHIMQKRKNRRRAMLVAAAICCAVLLRTGMGMAESGLPVPDRKPNFIADAPLPELKPVSRRSLTLDRDVLSREITTAKAVPVPAQKPISEKEAIDSRPTLSRNSRKLYEEIFALQDTSHLGKAERKISELDNGLLLGHVEAQRLLHPSTRSSFADLKDWLDKYSDHPQADQIYVLAARRKPSGFNGSLKKPQRQPVISGALGAVSRAGKIYYPNQNRSRSEQADVRRFLQTIRKHVRNYEPTQALNLLTSDPVAKKLDTVEYDIARSLIAAGYLYAGKLDAAQEQAGAALKRSGQYAPMAGWVSGLVNWQRENYKQAAQSFEVAATSHYSSGWLISAAGYWASRSHMRAGNIQVVSRWLELSASFPRTFYGLISTRALGQDYDFDWNAPRLTKDYAKAIESTPQGIRAKALIEVGQIARAEAELVQLYSKNADMRQALLAYAYEYKLPALTMRLGHAVTKPGGDLYDAALYPIIPWEPTTGYKLDKALIHAVIRQESKFNTAAESHSGATGLMQLMPATASYIAGNSLYKNKDGRYQLRNPHTNLDIGQTYIERLLNHKAVGQDLLSLAIAYNAGPGNLSRWKSERTHITDPLLFIETIPFAETRAFVERVLSNYWIYRLQMDQQTPSLDAVAEGRWARYAAQDTGSKFAGR